MRETEGYIRLLEIEKIIKSVKSSYCHGRFLDNEYLNFVRTLIVMKKEDCLNQTFLVESVYRGLKGESEFPEELAMHLDECIICNLRRIMTRAQIVRATKKELIDHLLSYLEEKKAEVFEPFFEEGDVLQPISIYLPIKPTIKGERGIINTIQRLRVKRIRKSAKVQRWTVSFEEIPGVFYPADKFELAPVEI
jgi:hypothetical protein